MDDFLTQPWFIAILGSILAIMMLSFGGMVFVKRKHMLMKQSTLSTIQGKFIAISHHNCRSTGFGFAYSQAWPLCSISGRV